MTNLDLSLVTRERGEPQVPPGLRTQGALVHACKSMRLLVTEMLALLGNDSSSQALLSAESTSFSQGVFDRKVWGKTHRPKAWVWKNCFLKKPQTGSPASPASLAQLMLLQC